MRLRTYLTEDDKIDEGFYSSIKAVKSRVSSLKKKIKGKWKNWKKDREAFARYMNVDMELLNTIGEYQYQSAYRLKDFTSANKKKYMSSVTKAMTKFFNKIGLPKDDRIWWGSALKEKLEDEWAFWKQEVEKYGKTHPEK